MQIQQKNNYSNTIISIPLSFTISKTSELQLQDSTKGDIVTPQEWIARELARIRQNITPRHCPNHESLLEVIEDMSKFLKQQVPQYQQQQQLQQATLGGIVTPERDRVIAKELLILQQQQERRWGRQRPDNNNNNTNNNNCNTCQQQNNSPTRGAAIEGMKFNDLVNALVHVIRYSDRHVIHNNNPSTDKSDTASTRLNTPGTPAIPRNVNDNTNYNDPHPVQLVRIFDDIRILRDQDGGRIKDPILAQQQLFSILFGHVQLTSQLFNPWQIICEWAKQLIYTRDWHEWMGFGLDAFIKAKNQCVTMDTSMYNPSSSPSCSSSISSNTSSSSCGSDHHQSHSGQLMMEQLQMLLQNIHLVEKTFRT